MKKIGILTFHKSINYGSVLQAYALRKTLGNIGYDAQVIDYQPDNYNYLYGLVRKPRSFWTLKYNFFNILHSSFMKNRKKLFAKFREEFLNLSSEKYQYGDDISPINEKYDAVICGSDQIWNPKAKDSDINFYLPFNKKAKKISYAVSLNDGFADEYEDKEKYKNFIRDFDRLSVREKSAEKDLADFIGNDKNIKVVLDPSLLLKKEDYEPICAEKRVNKPYIFLYSVHHKDSTVRTARKLSEKFSMPVYFLYTDFDAHKTAVENRDFIYPKKDTSPKEFISFIKNAELVVTDSFHGTAFSIVFEKKFFSVASVDENGAKIRDERICGILERLNLEDRFISEKEADSVSLRDEIDYTSVNKIRDQLIEKSLGYLKSAID